MKELKVFKQQEVLSKEFKIYGDIENPLFLAKDVAEWIEHSDRTKMLKGIDEEEKVKNIVPTLGGNQFISKYLNKHGQPKTDRESIQRVRFINYNLQLSMMCIKSILNSYSNFNIRNMEE